MLHVQANQTFFIEYENTTERRSYPKVNFLVEYGGEVALVPDFHVVGSKDPPFLLFGRMTGVSNLTLGEAKKLIIGENASTGFIKNGSYVQEPIDGELSFGILNMEADAKLLKTGDLNLDVGTLFMKKGTRIPARRVEMTIIDAHLEGGSMITTSGQGPSAGQGLGAGLSSIVGSGAGHGGPGGPNPSVSGGTVYGSYIYPVHPGSGGGNGAGGIGGGAGGSTVKVSKSCGQKRV